MSEPEPEFEELRRLLALKRHEQPPPGYFDNFSTKVRARIQAEEMAPQGSWFQRAFELLIARPAQTGLAGAAFVALIAAAAIFVPTEGDVANVPLNGAGAFSTVGMPMEPVAVETQPLDMALRPLAPNAGTSSLNPVLAPDSAPPGLFNASGVLGLRGFDDALPVSTELQLTNGYR